MVAVLFVSLSVGVYGQSDSGQNNCSSKNKTATDTRQTGTQKTGAQKKLPDTQTYPATLSPAGFARNFVRDQRDIWTSPFRARVQDLNWMVPLIGLTAGMINADSELSSRINKTGTLAKNSGNL